MTAALQLPLPWTLIQKNQIPSEYKAIADHAQGNIDILIKLLRDVKLENRMETLIKAESIFDGADFNEPQEFDQLVKGRLNAIREDLENEIYQLKCMMVMLEQTETFFP